MISLDNPARLTYHKLRAITANIINWFPSKNMIIVGVTGTNWKTTTCNIIARWLIKEGKKVFMFTTVNVIIWDQEFVNNTKMTSPDPFLLQKYLKMAKEKWCEIAIIETASHWIKMHRIWWIEYDICVLTNITQDHLDLHRTMRDYVKTKLTIFKKLIAYKRKPWIKKTAVLNMNSAYLDDFLDQTYDSLYKYWDAWNANVRAENLRIEGQTTKFDITVFYYNPNIDNEEEYKLRVAEEIRLINMMPFEREVKFMEGRYEPELFHKVVKGHEKDKEGQDRCKLCFELRLEEAARVAKKYGFDYFTTTLSISPMKSSALLCEIGERVGEEYGVKYLPTDFKKKNGYKRSVELSKEFDLYRQNYCGCWFSQCEAREREERRKAMQAEG